jgi:hypothetical protein
MQRRVAGIAFFKIDGRQLETAGSFTVNPGQPMREGKLGTSRVAGFSDKPQIPSIEGKIVLTPGLSLKELTTMQDVTLTVEAPNGSTFILREAWFSGAGTYTTEEGEVAFKFEGASFEEITA